MFRRVLAVSAAVALVATATADLSACGDKFLRAGRSARTRGYAAVHPASVLIYKPNATADGLQKFEALLKKAGHKPAGLRDPTALSRALTTTRYDIVIVDYKDAAGVKSVFASSGAEPALLPMLEEPSKAFAREVEKQYHCVLRMGQMTESDALEEIDHLMAWRRKSATATRASK